MSSSIKWRRASPACKAHSILEKMFKDEKISADTSPANVYKLEPEFQKYNLNVFRTAFYELRQKHGVGCKFNHIFSLTKRAIYWLTSISKMSLLNFWFISCFPSLFNVLK